MALTHDIDRTAQQQSLLQRFTIDHIVDCHCHVLPGVDDGPATMPDAIELCRMMTRDGITDAIATPHQLGRWDGTNSADAIRRAVSELQTRLNDVGVPLRVHVGGEVRLDERIPELLRSDRILTLMDSRRFLLLELSSQVQIAPDAAMRVLSSANVTVVLAHAERYEALVRDAACARAWIDAGAVLQVNTTSLLGAFGKDVMRNAWQMLQGGLVSLIATDAHSVGTRRPRFLEAIDAIGRTISPQVAEVVCVRNPHRLLTGVELGAPLASAATDSMAGTMRGGL
jgi:protein-tyrosine phosphatase